MDYLIQILIMYSLAESANCIYPRLEEDYNGNGLVCSWTEEDFYYYEKEYKWILFPKNKNDNYIEAKSRDRYWKKRNDS